MAMCARNVATSDSYWAPTRSASRCRSASPLRYCAIAANTSRSATNGRMLSAILRLVVPRLMSPTYEGSGTDRHRMFPQAVAERIQHRLPGGLDDVRADTHGHP